MTRFLHTADLQLINWSDSDPPELRIRREARLQTLEAIVDLARQEEVDFLLICGDLFEDNYTSDVLLFKTLRLLQSVAPLPVYILPGNHDPYSSGSVYRQSTFRDDTGNVRVLAEPAPVRLPGEVVLYPCPVTQRTSPLDPTSVIPPRESSSDVRVGIAHGSLQIESKYQDDDHPISLDAAEVRGLDYLALGHWHSRLVVEGHRLAYPGTPEPTAFGETDSGNVLLVSLPGAGQPPQIETRQVGKLTWVDREEQVNEPFDEAFRRLRTDLERLPDHRRTLLRLTLQGALQAESLARLSELEAWLQAAGFLRTELRSQVRCLEKMHGALQRLAERDEVVAGTAADLRLLATLDHPEPGPSLEVQPRSVEDLLAVWQGRCAAKDLSPEILQDLTREQVAEEALLWLSRFAQEVDR